MLTLPEIYQNEKDQVIKLLSYRKPDNEKSILSSLWYGSRIFAAYAISQQDFAKARHYLYQCGRLDMMRVRKFNDHIFDYGLNNTCMMLLSDSLKLANDYATLRYVKAPNSPMSMEEMVAKGASPIWPHSLFMIIQDNKEQLGRNLESIRKNNVPKGIEHDINFLQGMHDRDNTAVERTLQEIATPAVHKTRLDPPNDPVGGAIFFAAAGYAKLARMKGMEIKLNSPVVPEAMLTIEPLPAYKDEYDFVAEYLIK
jgi:hypothetical protein